MIDEGNCVTAADVDFTHVRNIEQPRVRARAKMFSHGAGGVLDRHVPAAKFNHAPAQTTMKIVERSAFQFRSGRRQIRFSA